MEIVSQMSLTDDSVRRLGAEIAARKNAIDLIMDGEKVGKLINKRAEGDANRSYVGGGLFYGE